MQSLSPGEYRPAARPDSFQTVSTQGEINMADLKSIVTGTVWKVEMKVGDRVQAGDAILIMESMKMEIPIEALAAGTLTRLLVKEGDSVTEGEVVASVA
jgi:acetyl-CoA carboxylase biotin carboxyl carrier protein